MRASYLLSGCLLAALCALPAQLPHAVESTANTVTSSSTDNEAVLVTKFKTTVRNKIEAEEKRLTAIKYCHNKQMYWNGQLNPKPDDNCTFASGSPRFAIQMFTYSASGNVLARGKYSTFTPDNFTFCALHFFQMIDEAEDNEGMACNVERGDTEATKFRWRLYIQGDNAGSKRCGMVCMRPLE